ncbi:fimbriae protein [Sphingomonas metalli]|uniref:Fimbriae protein n=1 Tax=Sphingomonas metalli TaxID=1779358 RepID=A0A916WRT0_9SPHN|nr:fimbria/pilus outer membrane usher protein [Sphingomonas metalli]GGB28492.1 fimbriae protein [Sphingomonas metalli]
MRLFLLLAALIGWATPVAAAPAEGVPPPAAVAAGPAQLFVELVVNGQANGALAGLVIDRDALLVEATALHGAGIATPAATGTIDVAHMTGLRATYDAPEQRLLLDVDPALLPLRRISAPAGQAMAPTIDTGFVLNYDLFAQAARGVRSIALSTEQRVFGRFGTVSNTGVLTAGGPRARRGYVRLETRYRRVDEDRALELNAGDLITRVLPWNGAVRIGGAELSRNFALRPDLITVPLPSFAGEAAVPTGVDLFIDGYRQSRAEVAPGRFVLDSVPVVNGAGEARIVTTDAVGRQIATVIPFYVAPELLRPGLTDFSTAAGFLRRGFGLRSFDYARAVATASARHGLTRHLTLSGHAEGTRGLANGGVGAAWSPGLWGALNGALSVSRAAGRTGRQLTLGYSFTSRRLSLGAEHVERSAGYRDIAGFDLARFAGSRRSDRVSASLPVSGFGSVGIGYVSTRAGDGLRARLASASASVPIGRAASAFAAVDYDFGRHAVSAQLRLVLPFGRTGVASAGLVRAPDGSGRMQASVARTPRPAGGIGYAADLAADTRGEVLGQASASWRTERMQVEVGGATNGGARSGWAGVTGSVAMLDGHVFAARALPGAFAVVQTGMARVPVYYENQAMGQTDRGGRLFVPNVVAYQPARFAIDPIDLPLGTVADRTETRAAIRAGTGGIVRLPVAVRRSVTARIVDRAGVPLPPGTLARLDGDGASRSAPIGWDGILLIEALTGRVTVSARTADGGACRATMAIAAAGAPMADLGAVPCR